MSSLELNGRVRVFPSKRDGWITGLIWGIALAIWFNTVRSLRQIPPGGERLLAAVVGLLVGLGLLWLWSTTRYRALLCKLWIAWEATEPSS